MSRLATIVSCGYYLNLFKHYCAKSVIILYNGCEDDTDMKYIPTKRLGVFFEDRG